MAAENPSTRLAVTTWSAPWDASPPPSFGAGSLALTVNVSPAVAMDAGKATNVTVNVQRMADGPSDYKITGKPHSEGISVAPVSGKFDADGSGTSTVEIKVAESVRDGYHTLVLTTKAGAGERTFLLLNVVGGGGE